MHYGLDMLIAALRILSDRDRDFVLSTAGAWVIIKVAGHHHRWLEGGYDLEIGHF